MLAFICGLILLLMQVPRRPANPSLRISGSDGTPLATLSPEVLSQALSERAQGVPGVRRRTVFITGSPSKPWNQADTSVAPDCGVEWTVAELRKQLNEDVATSLGTPPKQLDVLRATGARGELEVNIEGRHGPAVTGNHWNGNRRMRRGAGRASLCPTFVVGRAPPFTRPGLSLSSRFAQSADHFGEIE